MAENHAEHDNKKKVKQMERVQKILDLGKKKGLITYKEIVEVLDDAMLSSEQMDLLYDLLEANNIDVIDEDIEKEIENNATDYKATAELWTKKEDMETRLLELYEFLESNSSI